MDEGIVTRECVLCSTEKDIHCYRPSEWKKASKPRCQKCIRRKQDEAREDRRDVVTDRTQYWRMSNGALAQ